MLTQGLATKGLYPGGTVGIALHGYNARVLFIVVTPEEVYYPSAPGAGGIVRGRRRSIEDNSYIVLQDENDIITIIMVGLGSGIIH